MTTETTNKVFVYNHKIRDWEPYNPVPYNKTFLYKINRQAGLSRTSTGWVNHLGEEVDPNFTA